VAVRKVTDIGRSLGINQFGPDAPLARELQGTSGAVRRLVSVRLPPSLRALAVYARADLPLEPRPWPHELPDTCPGWHVHAAVPVSSKVTSTVAQFLRGSSAPGCPGWVEWLGHTTDAFGAPSPVASH
jgi:hypothetical protein